MDAAMDFNRPLLARYRDIRHEILDGDLLLVRRRGLISIAGRGAHSHAAKAAWWRSSAPAVGRSRQPDALEFAMAAGNRDILFCLEVRELHGGRAVTLSSQVKRFPGRIDVFQANA